MYLDARLDATALVEQALAEDGQALVTLVATASCHRRGVVLLNLVALARDLARSLQLTAGVSAADLPEAARVATLARALIDDTDTHSPRHQPGMRRDRPAGPAGQQQA